MVTSATGRNMIKKFEGLRTRAYKDSVGVCTIGYGHTNGVRVGMTITKSQAEQLLSQDIVIAEKAVNIYQDRYKFNQNEYDALVDFTFNLGAGNLNKLLQKGLRKKSVIADKILAYNKAGKSVLNGLVKRRNEERTLFLTPVKSNTVAMGVDYSKVFDAAYYAERYSDLKVAYGSDANALFQHFLVYGMNERRQAIAGFDVDIYLKDKDNADVLAAVTKKDSKGKEYIDYPKAYRHYCEFGFNEGRRAI